MKILLSLIALLSLSACVTTPQGAKAPDPAVLRVVAMEAAAVGSQMWLANNPDDREKFELARTSLRALIATGNGTPADLRAALISLPIDQLKGQNGAVIITSAVILLDSAGQQITARDSKGIWANYVLPVAQGLDMGLTQTLGN